MPPTQPTAAMASKFLEAAKLRRARACAQLPASDSQLTEPDESETVRIGLVGDDAIKPQGF